MNTALEIIDGVCAMLVEACGNQVPVSHGVVPASLRLGMAMDRPSSQIKPAIVTLAAIGYGFAVLNLIAESRKRYWYGY